MAIDKNFQRIIILNHSSPDVVSRAIILLIAYSQALSLLTPVVHLINTNYVPERITVKVKS